LGLLLLIGFITVKGSGMRGKSSVIRVSRYLFLPPIERKPRPSDALRMALGGEGSRTKNVRAKSEGYIPQLHYHHKFNITVCCC
jgi:hypothetical protein